MSGPCAKAVVKAVLILPNGRRFTGTNSCRNPQTVCPRIAAGHGRDDYRLCGAPADGGICDQQGHAEIQALSACWAASESVVGATAYVSHHRVCAACTRTLEAFGVKAVLGAPPPEPDPVVEAVRDDLWRRSEVGIAKYGTTLARTDLDLRSWLSHAYEEALDMALYLRRSIIELDAKDAHR